MMTYYTLSLLHLIHLRNPTDCYTSESTNNIVTSSIGEGGPFPLGRGDSPLDRADRLPQDVKSENLYVPLPHLPPKKGGGWVLCFTSKKNEGQKPTIFHNLKSRGSIFYYFS